MSPPIEMPDRALLVAQRSAAMAFAEIPPSHSGDLLFCEARALAETAALVALMADDRPSREEAKATLERAVARAEGPAHPGKLRAAK